MECWGVGCGCWGGTYPGAAVPQQLRDVVDRWISHYELDGNQLVLYLDEVCPPVSPITTMAP